MSNSSLSGTRYSATSSRDAFLPDFVNLVVRGEVQPKHAYDGLGRIIGTVSANEVAQWAGVPRVGYYRLSTIGSLGNPLTQFITVMDRDERISQRGANSWSNNHWDYVQTGIFATPTSN